MATISVTANMSMDKSAAKNLITQIEKAKTDAINIDTTKAERCMREGRILLKQLLSKEKNC